MNYPIQYAPHLKRKTSTFIRRMEFFGCVFALYLIARITTFCLYGKEDGRKVLLLGIVSLCFSVLPDLLFYLKVFFQKDFTGNRVKEYLYRVFHSYSYISGLILVLLCPVTRTWWKLALADFFSVFVFKLIFGGFGHNILNPAVLSLVFLEIAFPSDYALLPDNSTLLSCNSNGCLYPTRNIGSVKGFAPLIQNRIPRKNTLLGFYHGYLGETFALAILLIGVLLCVLQVVDWRVPVFFLATTYLSFLLRFLSRNDGASSFRDAFSYLCLGGILFGGVFCLTDPVTTPTGRAGKIRASLTCALVTLLIRLFTKADEGVYFAILIINIRTPFFDKINKGKTSGKLIPYTVCICLFAACLSVGLAFGLTHKVNPETGRYLSRRLSK